MKQTLILLSTAALLTLCGCSGVQSPPNALEQHFFDVTTNMVPRITSTTRIVTLTNEVNQIVLRTNVVNVTNTVPEYAFAPNASAGAVEQIGGIVGNFFGLGGAVSTGLAGLFGLWASLRSRRNGQTAANLAQIVETGRQILQTLPNGDELDAAYKQFMISHQADAGTISQIAKLLATAVDTDSARGAARQITDLIDAAQKGVTEDAS